MIQQLTSLAHKYNHHEIFIISSRPESTRFVTEEWLLKHKVSHDRLILCDTNYKRSQCEVFENMIKQKWNINRI